MSWDYWRTLYINTHCAARGLSSKSMAAYDATIGQFQDWLAIRKQKSDPQAVADYDVLEYLRYLREERNNGPSAVSRQVTILRNFYRAIAAMGHIDPDNNPLAHLPRIKGPPRKLPVVLNPDEVQKLLAAPPTDTVLGIRDRAILTLLYSTGIRATECATLREEDVDLQQCEIRVTGKGGHQRVLPLNRTVAAALSAYRQARGEVPQDSTFFYSLRGKPISRGAIYERVRTWSRRAKLKKKVGPHALRHTFATALLRNKTGLHVIRELLGHRFITSTQIYTHVSPNDLREAIDQHPVSKMESLVAKLLPDIRLPIKHPPRRRQRRASG